MSHYYENNSFPPSFQFISRCFNDNLMEETHVHEYYSPFNSMFGVVYDSGILLNSLDFQDLNDLKAF